MHSEGRVVWTKVSIRATAAGDGQRHYLVVLENFTDRKIFEEQLQVALRDQQTLFETMSVGVAQTMSGKILLANREFAEMFGYSDGQVIGMPLWDLTIDRDNRMPNELSGMPVVRANRTTSAEVVLFRRDGEPIWCLVQARPIEGQEPGLEVLREAIYTFQDITEMKRQREALSRSLVELNVVLDATSTGVLHLADDRIIRGNAAGTAAVRTSRRRRGGSDVFVAVRGRDRSPGRDEVLKTQLAPRRPASFEARMHGAEGNFWGLVSLRALDANDGRAGHDRVHPRHLRAQAAGRGTADRARAAAADLRHGAGRPAVRARRPSGARQCGDGRAAGLRSRWPGERRCSCFRIRPITCCWPAWPNTFDRINEAGACEFELQLCTGARASRSGSRFRVARSIPNDPSSATSSPSSTSTSASARSASCARR